MNLLSSDALSPFVSVIIPVYNDPAGLADTLKSISVQDYPLDNWEVIVVDNNSNDHTILTAQSFKSTIPSLRIEKEPKQSSYAARNKGISIAKGDILSFIDSDMTVNLDFLSKGVAVVLDKHVDYLGCRVDIYTLKHKPTIWETFNIHTDFPIAEYMEKFGFSITGNLFVKKSVFEKVGLFDQRLQSAGDLEFGNRVRDAGFKMHYSDDIVMKHPARSSMEALFKKNVRVANGHADLSIYYPKRYGEMAFLPVLFGFIPSFRLHSNFNTFSIINKFQMMLINNYMKYIGACIRLIRYLKFKIL